MKRALVASLLAVLPLLVHAGAWGEGSFENDDALDWVGQCMKAGTTAPVSAALAAVLDGRYVQAPDGSEAVAAAEVVAAAMGKPGADMPPELRAWMRRQPADELRGLAPRAARHRPGDCKAPAARPGRRGEDHRLLWSEGAKARVDYLADKGRTRILEFPLPADAASIARICGDLLTGVYAMRADDLSRYTWHAASKR